MRTKDVHVCTQGNKIGMVTWQQDWDGNLATRLN